MTPQVKTFEDFLIDKFAEEYTGLDDEMPDAFDNWLQELNCDDWLQYGEEYGQRCQAV